MVVIAQGSERKRYNSLKLLPPRIALRAKFVMVALIVTCTAAGETLDPASALSQVKDAFEQRDYEKVLEIVRSMRIHSPDSIELPEALLIAARGALASEPYRARFFVDSARSHPNISEAVRFEIAFVAAELFRREGLLSEAFIQLQHALRLTPSEVTKTRIDQVRLHAAELALYELNDRAAAIYLAKQISNPAGLQETEGRAYDRLVKNVLWRKILPNDLGLSDANISVISVDGDDIWIGTFNGGAARYSQSTGLVSQFTPATSNWLLAETIRSLATDSSWVWFGTFEGLSVYSKATSRIWRIEKFGAPGAQRGAPPPLSIVALANLEGAIAVSAIGAIGDSRGLWIANDPDGDWKRVQDGEFPGRRVTSLVSDNGQLYIGTEDRGLSVMNINSGIVYRPSAPWTAGVVNIRALTVDERGTVWIGTYGTGLFRWNPRTNSVFRYSTDSGDLADDYVLSAISIPGAVVVGTFGAGAYIYSIGDDEWTAINLDSGLTSTEITSLARAGPFTYFGTLGGGVEILADSLENASRSVSF